MIRLINPGRVYEKLIGYDMHMVGKRDSLSKCDKFNRRVKMMDLI